MKNILEYKGYLGSVEVDLDGGAIVGKLLFIRDAIGYSAAAVGGIEAAFHEAVDEYLQTCEELGDEPDTPCKGVFNVRTSPDLHRDVAIAARNQGVSLNEFVNQALTAAVAGTQRQRVEHVHTHDVIIHTELVDERVASSSSAFAWEEYVHAIQ